MDINYHRLRTVAILSTKDRGVVATGCILTRDGVFITVDHAGSLQTCLVETQKFGIQTAKLLQRNSKYDFSVYKIVSKSGFDYYGINTSVLEKGQILEVFGFPRGRAFTSYTKETKVTGSGTIINNDKSIIVYSISSHSVSEGMSGGPVVYPSTGEIVGIIKGYDKQLINSIFGLDNKLSYKLAERFEDVFLPLKDISLHFEQDIRDKLRVVGLKRSLSNQTETILSILGLKFEKIDLEGNLLYFFSLQPFNVQILIACIEIVKLSSYDLVTILDAIDEYREKQLPWNKINKKYCIGYDFSMDLQKVLEKLGYEYLGQDEIINEFVNFTDYIDHSISENKINIDSYYPLPAEIIENGITSIVSDVGAFLEKRLNDSETNKIFVTGKFGSGKSTLCSFLQNRFLLLYQAMPDTSKLPFFLELKSVNGFTIREKVSDILEGRNINSLVKDRLIKEYDSLGRTLYILDGIDEMPHRFGKKSVPLNEEYLSRQVADKANYVLTCREEYYESNVKSIEDSYSQQLLYGKLIRVKIIDLNRGFVSSYLNEHLQTNYSLLSANLQELILRPFFLEYFIKMSRNGVTFDRFKGGAKGFIRAILENWNSISKNRSKALEATELIEISELIAIEMLNNDIITITRSQVVEVLENYKEFNSEDDLYNAYTDVLSNSWFVPSYRKDEFEFVHKSFHDYLISKAVDVYLSTPINDIIENPFLKVLTAQRLSEQIISFVAEARPSVISIYKLIKSTSLREHNESGFLGGNLLSILRKVEFDFSNRDFSNTNLSGANFVGLDLSDSIFLGANLYDSSLSNTIVDNADMRKANLEDADFKSGRTVYELAANNSSIYIASTNHHIECISLEDNISRSTFLTGHIDYVHCIDISPDGKYVLSGGRNKNVLIHDSESGEIVCDFGYHTSEVRSAKFIDDRTIVSCSTNGQVYKWQYLSSIRVLERLVIEARLWNIEILQKGIYLGILDKPGNLYILNSKDLSMEKSISISERISSIALWKSKLVLGKSNGTLTIFDLFDETSEDLLISDYNIKGMSTIKNILLAGDSRGNLFEVRLVEKKVNRVNSQHRDGVTSISLMENIFVSSDNDGQILLHKYDPIADSISLLKSIDATFQENRFSCKKLLLDKDCGLSLTRLTVLSRNGAIIE